jgi:Zinc finger, C2H2 type
MKPRRPVKSYDCNICGIVLVNSKELLKHQIAVHVDNMFQCQSCNKIFGTKDKFENHAAEIHGMSQNTTIVPTSYDDSESSSRSTDQLIAQNMDNELESNLFKKTIREKRARKRTRGPYRKSVSSLPS